MATGQLVFNLIAKTDRFSGGLRTANRSLSRFVSNGMATLAKFHLAVGGLRTALSALSEPLELAQTQMQAERKLEQVFKSTGGAAGFAADEIKKFAAERQKLTNFGDEETLQGAAVLGTFTNIKGSTFKQALVSAQDMSALLGNDLQSNIMQLGKALNSPAKGLEALTRSGVSFTEEQLEMIRGLEEIGRVADAQRIILAEVQKEFGGQAKALADPLEQLKNDMGDVWEEIGKGVHSLGVQIAKELDMDSAKQGAADFVQYFQEHWQADVVSGIHSAIEAGKDLAGIFEDIAESVKPIGEAVGALDEKIKSISGENKPGLLKLAQSPSQFALDWFGGGGANMLGAGTGKVETPIDEASLATGGSSMLFGLAKKHQEAMAAAAVPPEDFGWMKQAGPQIPKELLEQRDRMTAEGQKIAEQMRTPVEQFQDEIGRLTTLFEGGFINSETFDRAAESAMNRLPDDTEEPTNQVRTLEAQSAETFEVLRANVGVGDKGKVPEKQLSELKKIAKGIDKLNKQDPPAVAERGFD